MNGGRSAGSAHRNQAVAEYPVTAVEVIHGLATGIHLPTGGLSAGICLVAPPVLTISLAMMRLSPISVCATFAIAVPVTRYLAVAMIGSPTGSFRSRIFCSAGVRLDSCRL